MSFAQLDGESDVEVDGQEKEEGANELGRLVGPAPFSYLTLYCLTFNKVAILNGGLTKFSSAGDLR